MRNRRFMFDWITLCCDSPSAIFIPISPWMPAIDVAALRMPFELRGLAGNAQARAAYQTCNDQRNPDTEAEFGGTKSAEGFEDPSGVTDVSTAFAGKEWFRLGFAVSNTSGTNFGGCRVSGHTDVVPRTG